MKSTALAALISASAFAAAPATYDRVPRLEFNQRAIELHLPLFWRVDANSDKTLQADELAVLWTDLGQTRAEYVDAKGAFNKKFAAAYEAIVKGADCSKLKGDEVKRCETVLAELRQGRATLIESDFSGSAEEKTVSAKLAKVAILIEQLHAKQKGTFGLEKKMGKDDAASRAVFFRNQGPQCAAPRTENDPACSALKEKPKSISGLYPADLQAKDPKFCEALEKEPNAKDLTGHFSVVEADKKGFKAVPYSVAFKKESEAIAKELEAAAKALGADEAAFKAYLLAAANAFKNNDWEPANEAWVAMGVTNSKYYLRVGPDEVYYEPCAWKAGYAMAFARVNKDSLVWQEKLEPVKADMEKALAALAGPPYAARDVKFKLPDFIEIALNAGDNRNPHGATIGQSLPNWGKVAEKGGRTVAMTNLYTDPDSQAAMLEQMSSLFCKATMGKASGDAKACLMSTLLHEAAHNLGPAHDYKVNGKEDDEVFGGPMASTLEELKAQTSALYFADWLADRKVISVEDADKAHVRDVAWAFGHISRGMYSADGKPKNYSQLASIQLGSLMKAGAISWKTEESAANGTDKGCLEIDLKKFRGAVDVLAKRVLKIKGSGDKADAEKLKAEFVDAKDEWSKMKETITERWLRAPKASFVYSFKN